jgi:hypothetical protein
LHGMHENRRGKVAFLLAHIIDRNRKVVKNNLVWHFVCNIISYSTFEDQGDVVWEDRRGPKLT